MLRRAQSARYKGSKRLRMRLFGNRDTLKRGKRRKRRLFQLTGLLHQQRPLLLLACLKGPQLSTFLQHTFGGAIRDPESV
jgi:hypothetical protein